MDYVDLIVTPRKESPEEVSMPTATTLRILLVGFNLSATDGYNVGNVMYLSYGFKVRYTF